jgi:hypothetical protein
MAEGVMGGWVGHFADAMARNLDGRIGKASHGVKWDIARGLFILTRRERSAFGEVGWVARMYYHGSRRLIQDLSWVREILGMACEMYV